MFNFRYGLTIPCTDAIKTSGLSYTRLPMSYGLASIPFGYHYILKSRHCSIFDTQLIYRKTGIMNNSKPGIELN